MSRLVLLKWLYRVIRMSIEVNIRSIGKLRLQLQSSIDRINLEDD